MTPVPVTLLVGHGLREGRSLALDAAAASGLAGPLAVLVEGGPGTLAAPPGVTLIQLAPGCMCCVGQLPLRVTLARTIRQVRPAHVWIEISGDAHLDELRRVLRGPGFVGAIVLSEPVSP